MNRILVAQPLFLPDENQTFRNVRSTASLLRCINCSIIKDNIWFQPSIGWANGPMLSRLYLKELERIYPTSERGEGFYISPQEHNSGKAWTLNHTINSVNFYWDYVLTCDSDIIFPQNTIFFDELLDVAKTIGSRFGYLSLNQTGNNVHCEYMLENTLSVNGKYNHVIKYSKYPRGIAGGCCFISRELWLAMEGFKLLGVYAGEDARLIEDAHKHGFTYGMLKSCSVEHPPDHDEEYKKWKIETCQVVSKTGIKDTFDMNMLAGQAEEFWKTK